MQLVADVKDNISWINADITDLTSLDFLEKGDILIHTAAIVSLASSGKEEMYEVNILGTENIVNAALHYKVGKLVHISSIAALGRQGNGGLTTERDNFDQSADNSPYSKSKYSAERHVWRGQQEGLDTIILNPSVILGAGFWGSSSAAIISRTAEGLPFYPRGSAAFVDVRDVAIAARLCMESPITDERFVINGVNILYKDFFALLTEKLKVKMPKNELPDWLGGLFWRWEKLKGILTSSEPVVTKHTVLSSRRKTKYDNSKSIELLKLHYTPLEKTLDDIVNAFLLAQKEGRNYAVLQFDGI